MIEYSWKCVYTVPSSLELWSGIIDGGVFSHGGRTRRPALVISSLSPCKIESILHSSIFGIYSLGGHLLSMYLA